MRLGLTVALLLCLLGCGVVEDAPAARQRVDSIVGGVADDGGLSEVVALRLNLRPPDGGLEFRRCSGTLITPTVAITAAHCTSALLLPGSTLVAMEVQNLSPATDAGWTMTASWRPHPSWNTSTTTAFDIGLVKLSAPITGVTPRPFSRRALTSADIGQPMDVVGYGITSSSGSDFGVRRRVQLPLRGLQTNLIELGDFTSAGICNGDSGGPSMMREPDGLTRVIGVHSRTTPGANCMDGVDTRVDSYGSFIRQFLLDTGGASCVEDSLCAAGCATPDFDCVCLADGACSAQCPNLLSDPDCPRDCVANSVCATQNCPTPDPDCTAELSACTQDAQCQHRTCATDPQRNERYCSRPCSATCTSGTQCVGTVCLKPQLPTASEGQSCTPGGTFCLGGAACTGPIGGATTCRRTCTTDADCATTHECVAGQQGARICEPKPPEAMPGDACTLNVTRCLGGTTCTGPVGGATTCRTTCTGNADCTASQVCLVGQGGARICEPRPPEVGLGGACTIGVTPCVAGSTCTGPVGGATTCRATCTSHGDCAPAEQCIAGQGGVQICEQEVGLGGACTIGVTTCVAGTACTGLPGEATRCLTTCVDFNDCSTEEDCEPGQGGVSLCVPAPHMLDKLSVEESKAAAAGCSSVTGAPGALALAALLLTRRRRR
ncbi:MAG: trypsin-like serine protease [Myxococcota bacterium]